MGRDGTCENGENLILAPNLPPNLSIKFISIPTWIPSQIFTPSHDRQAV